MSTNQESIRGIDPRGILRPDSASTLSQNISDYTLFVDRSYENFWGDGSFGIHIEFAAKSKLAGIEPRNPSLFLDNDYSLLQNFKTYGFDSASLDKVQRAHYEFMRTSANGKIMGAYINIDERTREMLSDHFNQRNSYGKSWYTSEIQSCEYTGWYDFVYAKILGLDVELPEKDKEDIAKVIKSHQKEIVNECYREDVRKGGPIRHSVFLRGLPNSLAQARILGIDVPVMKETADLLSELILESQEPQPEMVCTKEGIKTEHKLTCLPLIPKYLSDFAIISARELKVGGPRGLELVF